MLIPRLSWPPASPPRMPGSNPAIGRSFLQVEPSGPRPSFSVPCDNKRCGLQKSATPRRSTTISTTFTDMATGAKSRVPCPAWAPGLADAKRPREPATQALTRPWQGWRQCRGNASKDYRAKGVWFRASQVGRWCGGCYTISAGRWDRCGAERSIALPDDHRPPSCASRVEIESQKTARDLGRATLETNCRVFRFHSSLDA
jgi:hypothetical protein